MIKYIEITGNIAYVLYEHYFSAVLAYNILKDIIVKDNKTQLFIKLMTKDTEEEDPKPFSSILNIDDFFVKETYLPPTEISTIDYSVLDEEPMLCINPFDLENQANKYVCTYEIQIDNDESFKVTSRIIGVRGLNVKKLLYDSCRPFGDNTTKLRLRGKGSGYREGYLMTGIYIFYLESDDPLQLCISSLHYDAYSRLCENVERFLSRLYYEYYVYLLNVKGVKSFPKTIKKYEYVVYRSN